MSVIDNPYNLPLGRLPSIDFNDKKFLLRPPAAATITRRYRHWVTGPVLDQGETSQCVSHSGWQYLYTGPVKNIYGGTVGQLYDVCQEFDEWAGTPHEGTSVRALFKVFKQMGYVSQYQWAFDVDTVIRHVLTTGPVVLGTNWYLKMFDPDRKNGFIHIDGPIMGGHAYMVKGVNLDMVCPDGTKGAFRIINSWGRQWGQDGLAWMSFPTVARLISEYGEAATSTEIKFKTVS